MEDLVELVKLYLWDCRRDDMHPDLQRFKVNVGCVPKKIGMNLQHPGLLITIKIIDNNNNYVNNKDNNKNIIIKLMAAM